MTGPGMWMRSVLALAGAGAVVFGALALPEAMSPVMAGPHYPEPCLKSTLCRGLSEYFGFANETGGDQPFYGAFGAVLNEPVGANITTRLGHQGVNIAPEFAGTTSSFLWQSFTSGPTGFYTIALWVYPDTAGSVGQYQYVMSWDSSQRRGASLYLYNNGGTLQATHQVWERETGNSINVSQNISAGGWRYVVFGASTYLDGGTNSPHIFISVDGAAKSTASIGYSLQPGCSQIRIGCRPVNGPAGVCDLPFDGAIDKLAFWARELTPAELTLLYNSGSGHAYPFVTE